jgi:hypothetical protein
MDEACIPIKFDKVFWKIFVKELDLPKGKLPCNGEPVIELEWGWSAGLSDKTQLAEDAPTGKMTVCTTLSMAIELRDALNQIIAKHNR